MTDPASWKSRSEADVAFFHSGLKRWRVSRVRLETSYQGRVDRKQAR